MADPNGCPTCAGKGSHPLDAKLECGACRGTGKRNPVADPTPGMRAEQLIRAGVLNHQDKAHAVAEIREAEAAAFKRGLEEAALIVQPWHDDACHCSACRVCRDYREKIRARAKEAPR